jgi:hypothetical protein
MKFYLLYRGKLKGNGDSRHKHEIRKELDPQMRSLWQEEPLINYKSAYLPGGSEEKHSPFIFPSQSPTCTSCICLITSKAFFVADIAVTLFRPDAPGKLIHSGDIDNRLKTLLDALRMPQGSNEIVRDNATDDDHQQQDFLYCVLEDDCLISHLSVNTERLLLPVDHHLEVVALIKVEIKITRDALDFMGIALAM